MKVLFLALLFAQPDPSPAHQAHPVHALAFEDAMALADRHPRLGAGRAGVEEMRRRSDAVSWLANNPELSVSPGWRRGDGVDGFEGMLGISQDLSLSGEGSDRRAAAVARARAASARVSDEALALRLRVASSWIALRAVQLEVASLAEETRIAEELFTTFERAVGFGRLLAVDLSDARIYLEELRLEHMSAELRSVDLAHELAATLALPPTAAVEAVGPPPQAPLPTSLEAEPWLARAAALPRAELLALAKTARAAEVEALSSAAGPRLGTGFSLQREATGDVVGLVNLRVSVPIFDRNEHLLGDAGDAAVLGTVDAAIGLMEAQRTLVMALHEVEHTREVARHVDENLLPAVERHGALVQRQVEEGRVDVFDALRARRRIVAERRRQIEAERLRLDAEVRASFLLGAVANGGSR